MRESKMMNYVYTMFFLYVIGMVALVLGLLVGCTTEPCESSSITAVETLMETTTDETTTTLEETTETESTTTDTETTSSGTVSSTNTTESTTKETVTDNIVSTISTHTNQEFTTLKSYTNQEFQSEVQTESSLTTTTTVSSNIDNTNNNSNTNGLTFVKTFNRGTYYCYGCPMKGGSGRQLVSCYTGDGTVKGSIASSYLYRNYGYNYNGRRTIVYLSVADYPEMEGFYYLDDSDAGNSEVIDFFYISSGECPFRLQGVVKVDCYIDLGA